MTTTIADKLDTLGSLIGREIPGWHHVRAGERDAHYLIQNETLCPFNPFRGNKPAIHLRDDRGRLIVSGCWPTDPTHGWRSTTPSDVGGESPTITCAIDKPPHKIAADILRRFLPKYLDLHARCLARLVADNDGEAKQFAVAQEFADIMGTMADKARAHFYGDNCYGTVEINHGGDTGKLELRGNVAILKAALIAAGQAGAFSKSP